MEVIKNMKKIIKIVWRINRGGKIVKTIYHLIDGYVKTRNTSFITIHKNKETNGRN